MNFTWASNPEIWTGLFTLTALEIVLGIDNIIFISILAGRLPVEQQDKARKLGLFLALFSRIALLFSLSWIIGLKNPLFAVMGHAVTGKDLILFFGGLFLIAKSTREIHFKLEGEEEEKHESKAGPSFTSVLIQIMILDVVFSLDSVITAVGMVDQLYVMVAAVVIAVLMMLASAKTISDFINERPTLKILALSFLILIGCALVADGVGHHIPKGYIYFAMAFSTGVEFLNLRMRSKSAPASRVELKEHYRE